MAKSAKDYAREQLGELDLSYLKGEEDAANKTYGTTKSSLQTNFNNLVNQINANRLDTRKNFNTGRATVAENAYTANRQNQADLASRGIGSSGLKTLGEVGNRMETGKQYSNLANKFYSTMTDLDNTEKQSRDQYNIDLQTAKNTLDSALAGINSRRGEAQNNYNMQLGQLAEQVQGRWDANANAQAALAQAQAAAAQAHSDAVNAAQQQLRGLQTSTLADIVKGVNKNDPQSVDNARTQIQTIFQVEPATATKVLQQLGLEPTKSFNFDINKPYQAPTMQDLYNMLGIR
ncbi:MAG: hypothetical protein II625_09765 [Bacilli bacterium]|nr:hypothetical protein [Bacilli bacterium]